MDLAEQNAALTLRIQDAWAEIERLHQIEAAATSFLDAVEETIPGFTAERIEGEMSRLQATLDAKPRRPTTHWYLSTACHHALMGDESLHARCRVVCKYGNELCQCPVCDHSAPEPEAGR